MHRTVLYNESDLAKTVNSAEAEKLCSKARCVALRAHEKHLMLGLQPRSLRIEPPGWGLGLSIFIISPGDSDVKPALSTSGLMLTFWEKFSRMDPTRPLVNQDAFSLKHLAPLQGPGPAGHFGKCGCCTHRVSVSTKRPAQPLFSPFPPPPISVGGGVLVEGVVAGEHSWDSNHLRPQKSISSHLSPFSPF